MPVTSEIYFQLILAVLLGSLIGIERKISRKTAGMRTFAFVTLGATIFSIISEAVGTDPSRIAAQIVVGIGFLGTGLVVLRDEKERGTGKIWGLTTAAGLWVAAAIGMAIGYRFYLMAVFSTFLSIFIFLFLWWIEKTFITKVPSDWVRREDDDEKTVSGFPPSDQSSRRNDYRRRCFFSAGDF